MSSYYPPSVVIPIYSVFMGVAIFLTGLRLWVRLSFARIPLGADDFLILVGLVIAVTCNGIQYYNALKGTGGEAIKNPDDRTQMVIVSHQVDWAMVVIEKAGFGAVKLSILFFYRRIFGVWDSFRRVNNALIWIVVVWAVVFTIGDAALCGSHPELNWAFDQTIALRRCGNRGALLLAFSVTSVATDLPILGLPFFYIRRLQMAPGKKLATSFVFFLGTVSTGASILRLIFLIVSYPVGRLNFAYTPPPDDQTPLVLKVFNPTFWAVAELWLGVWAANLPPCSPLLRSISVNFHPYRMLSGAYRRSRKNSEADRYAEKDGKGGSASTGTGTIGSREERRNGGGDGDGRPRDWPLGRDELPLFTLSTPQGDEHGHELGHGHETPERPTTSHSPPALSPLEWTGDGRLSVLGLSRQSRSGDV
ncbi:hypothetical protein F4808DRAFT_193736 [Astrocystis sublimbata]|nr:hypothetical protein F4808DRAFT_193736 [Astrocystis sublimbata]